MCYSVCVCLCECLCLCVCAIVSGSLPPNPFPTLSILHTPNTPWSTGQQFGVYFWVVWSFTAEEGLNNFHWWLFIECQHCFCYFNQTLVFLPANDGGDNWNPLHWKPSKHSTCDCWKVPGLVFGDAWLDVCIGIGLRWHFDDIDDRMSPLESHSATYVYSSSQSYSGLTHLSTALQGSLSSPHERRRGKTDCWNSSHSPWPGHS